VAARRGRKTDPLAKPDLFDGRTANVRFRAMATTKRNPSDLGYIEDRWEKDDGTPKARNGQGRRYRARWVDEDGKERAASFATERAAKTHLRTVARGENATANGQKTFSDYYDQWAERQVWETSTRKAMAIAANSVPFGNVQLARLRPSHLETWVKEMTDKPLQPITIRTYFNNVQTVIRAALRDRALTFDVTARVRLPRVRRPQLAMSIPDTGEVGTLISAAGPEFSAFVGLCAFVGLRLGEAAALKVSDIDFLRRELQVSRQVQRVTGGIEIRPPKYGSERVVYPPDGLVRLLSEHVRLYLPGDDPDRWLFPGRGENPLHQDSVTAKWRRVRAAAGLDYRLHDLRHFYASGLIHAGCDVVTVQRALGHGSASFTLSTYAHLWPKAEDRTRKAAADMFAASTADPVRTAEA
jgi:integrase